jgi:bifunctional UDP-N-acetylglucosamine pyrophosphorylase/glucosamine-1-phosphate N-acetyltransferase
MTVCAIVLAGGQDARMRSNRPKPLHMICGRPMVIHVLDALEGLELDQTVVVVGHDGERVSKKVLEEAPAWARVSFVGQPSPRGSGDAALIGLSALEGDDVDDASTVLILPADLPLLRHSTVATLVEHHERSGAAVTLLSVLSTEALDSRRVMRASTRQGPGRVTALSSDAAVAASDGTQAEYATGVYAVRRDLLGPALRRAGAEHTDRSALGDIVEVLASLGHVVDAARVEDPAEVHSVDDRWQLATVERELRARTNRRWLLEGVTMLDPRQTFIDVTVELGRDVTLYPGTMLQGRTSVGDGCELGPDTRLVDCRVGADAVVRNTVGEHADIGAGARVGPFAHLGPGSVVEANASTGPFYTGPSDC